ncbi:MAG: peptide chain release factor N(5)-glutamine methyltransferase [Proteobacteria bacterium]|nr:peptide chain release factor N(5)-glutamine methyltransferase [Pseudomonadota bacterium]
MAWTSPNDDADEIKNSGVKSTLGTTWTIESVLRWSHNWLTEKALDKDFVGVNFRLDAELLLGFVLKIDRMKLYMQLDRPLIPAERQEFKQLLMRRVEGEPVHYILGFRDFWRHKFKVNQNVLIPRPDTEVLVEQALLYSNSFIEPKILDIGTGSGCIAISLAFEKADSSVTGWDVSEEALKVARENKDLLNCINVDFAIQNVFDEVMPGSQFDLVVSNPPYIVPSDRKNLSPSVALFEPSLALFDDRMECDGLSFYRRIAEVSQFVLKAKGAFVVECGLGQANDVKSIFLNAGFKELTITKDLSGIDRVVSGVKI